MVGVGPTRDDSRVGVLGPTHVSIGGFEVRISPQARGLVTRLALAGTEVVRIDALAESIWQGDPPGSHRKVIHNRVTELRHHSRGLIRSDGAGYALGAEVALDCAELEASVAGVERLLAAESPRAAVDLAARAAGLWRGTPFTDLDHHEAHGRRLVLEECWHVLNERRAEALLRCHDPVGAVVVLEALVTKSPLVERRWWLLVVALYASRRRSEALRAFQRARVILREEAGLDPGHELVELERAILDGNPVDLGRHVGGVASSDVRVAAGGQMAKPVRAVPQGVPMYTTSFIGRDAELRGLVAALRSERVVTLLGPPGVGKTRLAAEAMSALRADVPVAFIPLAPFAEPDLVRAAVAGACGVLGDTTEVSARALATALTGAPRLIVLDTCEHQVDAVRSLVEATAEAPVRFLLTSRVRLGVDGERVLQIQPLETGDAARPGPALELFESRARDELVDELDLDQAARIALRLDGLPLAIEMAAAQLRWTGIDELAEMVEERLTDLDRPPRRGADHRHFTLDQALDWSYALLDSESQSVLRSLSVFRGGFRIDAAVAVTGLDRAVLTPVLRGLVDRSLVVADRRRPARYRLLDSIGLFAGLRLTGCGEQAEAEERHLRWSEEFAQTARQGALSAEESGWIPRVDAELPNLVAAAQRARAAGNPERAARLIGPLAGIALVQTRVGLLTAATALSDDLLADPDRSAGPGVGWSVAMAAWVALRSSDLRLAGELAGRAIELAGDDAERSECYQVAASVAVFDGDLERMTELATFGEELARTVGHLPGIAINSGLRVMFGVVTDSEPRRDLAERCLVTSLEVGSPSFAGWGYYVMGVSFQVTDPARAIEHLQHALRQLESVEARFYTDLVLRSLGEIHAGRSPAEAVGQLVMAIRSQLAVGDVNHAHMSAAWLSPPLVALGFHTEAVIIEAVIATWGDPIARELNGPERVAALATARSALGPIAYKSSSVLGATNTLADVIERIGKLDLTEGR